MTLTLRREKGVALTNDEVDNNFESRQETLVSGENMKTINGESLLGPGDVAFPVFTREQILGMALIM